MFLKELIISSGPRQIIRDIEFKKGLNLIIDNTPTAETKLTGNNVGKTTVLKLIDFCLGGKPSIIYTDTENKNEVYQLVKEYLENNDIRVSLILKENLDDENSKEVLIVRNFLKNKNVIRQINGEDVLDKELDEKLGISILSKYNVDKPTFRQIISHNIRYKDDSINNTLKTLNKYTSDTEYETLYLFLLGCNYKDGEKKQELLLKLAQENTFKGRLENRQTKSAYEVALSLIEDEIKLLNQKKTNFNLNKNFEKDLDKLNDIKYKINKCSSTISKLNIRKELIEASRRELNNNVSDINIQQLHDLYAEATLNIEGIQKTFEDLVMYHNKMISEKIKFITIDLPYIINELSKANKEMSMLLEQEKTLTRIVSKSDSFGELEKVMMALNEQYRLKGEYENIISQINEVDKNIKKLKEEINKIDEELFSDDFEEVLKSQVLKFNKYFSDISSELYDEKYALKCDSIINKKGQQIHKFNAFNANMSSGKKQGEILCFDLAYIMFADNENIPCLHFLLNDKKELMHDNQLIKVADFVKEKNIQLVISILKDKLPVDVLENSHIAIELSQKDKLFRIQ